MRLLVPGICCLLLFTGEARANAENEDDDSAVSSLEASIPSIEQSEALVTNFKRILHEKHGGSAAQLFAAYNRFLDASKSDGEQALGNQEVRQLLKDIEIGNVAIRGEIANILILIVDSSGDARLNEREFAAALGIVDCWMHADPSNTFYGTLHSCAAAVRAWWQSGWLVRLEAEEANNPILATDLKHTDPAACSAALVQRTLAHVKKAKQGDAEVGAGHTAVRKALKASGLKSLLLRIIFASGLIDALDLDGDKKLTASEIKGPYTSACVTYGAILAREATITKAIRAISLPASSGGFPPADFVARLGDDAAAASVGLDASTLSLARKAVAAADPNSPFEAESPGQATAVAQAYVRLLPSAALALDQPTSKDEV